MPTTAKIIADSISESGQRITTMVLEYPRIIHSEFMTHRMFSRNASSSRAIPVEKQIERVENDPFIPTYWGKNQKGMQAKEEFDEQKSRQAEILWRMSSDDALDGAKRMVKLGLHKQLVNRLLEPFSHIQVVVTATEWENFFAQRLHPAAQPEIQELARVMKEAMDASTPTVLEAGEWHLPFITDADEEELFAMPQGGEGNLAWVGESLKKISVARCARVSYGLNERSWGDVAKDLALYDMLLNNWHASPFEHQATPMNTAGYWYDTVWADGITHQDRKGNYWSGNFRQWVQYRQILQQLS